MYGGLLYCNPPGPVELVVVSLNPPCRVVTPPVPDPVIPVMTLNLRLAPCPLTLGIEFLKGVGRGKMSFAGASKIVGHQPG